MKHISTLLLLVLVAPTIMGATFGKQVIECHTPRMTKTFQIANNNVTFYQNDESETRRNIASVNQIRTKRETTGFTKFLKFEGHKYTIHIQDLEKFSEVDDYILVRSKAGHEMTYPLTCNI